MTIDIIFSLYNLAVDVIAPHLAIIPQFPRYCCHAIMASCCACEAGLSVEEFCKKDWCPGCPPQES